MIKTLRESAFAPTEYCISCPSVTSEIHQFAESLGSAIDAKHHFTRQHSEEVAIIAQVLALTMKPPAGVADHIHMAAHLHDIGKISIPSRLLNKKEPLTEEEWDRIGKHPLTGAEIIAPVNFHRVNRIVEMVRYHHESYDGRDYPEGLKGEGIPLGARIIRRARLDLGNTPGKTLSLQDDE